MRHVLPALLFLISTTAAFAQTIVAQTAAPPRSAQPSAPKFELPIDCKFGENCDVMQLVDHDNSTGWRDYRCGYLSYDTHKGTDFRITSIDLMVHGVNVLAAAPGRVTAVRRGMADVSYRLVGRDVVTRRGLGNVVIIDHDGRWRTIYAHLKKDSIRVAKGQKVKSGQIIAQVGMSGLAEVPHLHFGVLRRNQVVDPFNGADASHPCGATGASLWTPQAFRKMRTKNAFILHAGFSDSTKFNRIALTYGLNFKEDFPLKAKNFIFAVDFGGGHKGDEYEIQIKAPGDKILAKTKKTIKKIVGFRFDFVGRKGNGRTWPKGLYKGQFALFRTTNGKRKKVLETERQIWVR
jgi:hypothetical protein